MCHVRCNICKYNPIKRKNEPISNVYILVYTYEYRRIDLTTLGKQHKEQAFVKMLILKDLIIIFVVWVCILNWIHSFPIAF